MISYTVIGLAVGELGGAITFNPAVQGYIELMAGAVLVAVLGLSMLSQGFVLAKMPLFTASAQTAAPEEYATAATGGVQVVNSVLSPAAIPI